MSSGQSEWRESKESTWPKSHYCTIFRSIPGLALVHIHSLPVVYVNELSTALIWPETDVHRPWENNAEIPNVKLVISR